MVGRRSGFLLGWYTFRGKLAVKLQVGIGLILFFRRQRRKGSFDETSFGQLSPGAAKMRNQPLLRILGMSWAVKTTCFEALGVSLGGSGVSIGGVKILRACKF